jgi:hypothetical protein
MATTKRAIVVLSGSVVDQIFADDGVKIEVFDRDLFDQDGIGVDPEFAYLAEEEKLPLKMAKSYVLTEETDEYPLGTVFNWNEEKRKLIPVDSDLPTLWPTDLEEYLEILEECGHGTFTGHYILTLADNAGSLAVHAKSRAELDDAIGEAADRIVKIEPESSASAEMASEDDTYFVGHPVYKSCLEDVIASLHRKRSLWWRADDLAELNETLRDIISKGATIKKVVPELPEHQDGPFSIVFSINPKDAKTFFGDVVDTSSYLDEDLRIL